MSDKMIQLTGLWSNTSKDGETYLTGNLSGGVRIVVFKNKFKKEPKHPDYQVYLSPSEKKEKPKDESGF